MNHHHRETLHRTTLRALFGHPVRAGIDVGKANHVSAEAGAEVANRAGNRVQYPVARTRRRVRTRTAPPAEE